MKTLRIGILLLVIGISLLFAAHLRAKTLRGRVVGPCLLEPRQTTIVLQSASSDNVTIHVVPAKRWKATQNISLANPVFTAIGMRKLYSATFKPETRGLYYLVVTTPKGILVDEVELKLEQTGLAQDLYLISIVFIIIGIAIIAYNGLKLIAKKKK